MQFKKHTELQRLKARGHYFLLPNVPEKLEHALEKLVPSKLTTDDEYEIRRMFREILDQKKASKSMKELQNDTTFKALARYVDNLSSKLTEPAKKELWQLILQSIQKAMKQ